MALNIIHLRRGEGRLAVGRAHRVELAGRVRGQQAAAYIVGKAYAGQHAVDLVSVAHGVGQALEDEHPGALAHHQPVGGRVEGGGQPGRGKRAQLGEAHLGIEAGRAGDTAGEHSVCAAGAEGVDRQFDGVERGGAGGVQGEAAACKPESAGDDAAGQAGHAAVERVGLGVKGGEAFPESGGLESWEQGLAGEGRSGVGGEDDVPDYDAGARAVYGFMLGVEESLLRCVQGQVEDRVQSFYKAFPQVQPGRVQFEILYETGLERIDLVGSALLRVEGFFVREEPAARGNVFSRADAFRNVLPEAREVGRAGKDPAGPDNGYRLLLVHFYPATTTRRYAVRPPSPPASSCGKRRSGTCPPWTHSLPSWLRVRLYRR